MMLKKIKLIFYKVIRIELLQTLINPLRSFCLRQQVFDLLFEEFVSFSQFVFHQFRFFDFLLDFQHLLLMAFLHVPSVERVEHAVVAIDAASPALDLGFAEEVGVSGSVAAMVDGVVAVDCVALHYCLHWVLLELGVEFVEIVHVDFSDLEEALLLLE